MKNTSTKQAQGGSRRNLIISGSTHDRRSNKEHSVTKRDNSRRLASLSAALILVYSAILTGTIPAAARQGDKATPNPEGTRIGYTLPEGFTSYTEFRTVNGQLRQTAAELTAASEKDPAPGYAGVELSLASRVVVLYWHGDLPSNLADAVAHQKARVEVKQARYSHLQLINQARKLANTRGHSTVSVVRVAVPVDGSALQVGVSGTAEQARRTLSADVDLAVTEEKAASPLYSRPDDSPPFWGGARTTNVTKGAQCSTGFTVRKPAGTAMLTAGHCGSIGDTFSSGAGTNALGQATAKDTTGDTLLVPTSAAGRVYDGDAWSSSSRPVAGTAANNVGDYMCTLGAFSGTRCDVVVQGIDEYRYTTTGWMGPLVRAEQAQHTNAAGHGDSGGPVISLTGPDWTLLMANGTISLGDPNTQVGCTGETNRSCYWRIWYADINRTLNQHGASIVTG
jgi:hypothetical protein